MNKNRNHMFRSLLILVLVFTVAMTGCSDKVTSSDGYRSIKATPMDSQALSSNAQYELLWDKDAGSVLLKSKESNQYWSDILYDMFLEGSTSSNANSALSITVVDTKTLKWDTLSSYSEIPENGSVLCKKIDNGIRVTYFFDKYKIAIPIEYVLNNDSVTVSLNSSNILEDGEDYKLVSVSVASHFCSIKNSAENGGLFVPCGNGAIMNTTEKSNGVRKFSGEVYGTDEARQIVNDLVEDESIKLPIFASYESKKGMLGIIEQGAGASVIDAQAGNPKLGYSSIGVTFYVRGYDEIRKYLNGNAITKRINENLSDDTFVVSYYPIIGENVDYNLIAARYRKYLSEKGQLEKGEVNNLYGVTFIGGTTVTESVLGIPNQKIASLTTYAQAYEVLKEIADKTENFPAVRMIGYGDKGLNAGEISGGKKYPKVFGTKKELTDLLNLCKEKQASLFFDSEIVKFNKSNLGFSIKSDVLKTAIGYRAQGLQFSPIRIRDISNSYYFLKGEKLKEAAKIALGKAEKYGYEGMSLSSLGTTTFSDYTNGKYSVDTEKYVKSSFDYIKKSGFKIAVADANGYALSYADVSFDTPSDNGNYDVFDEEIPFYQMIYHSYKPMYASGVNLSANTDYSVVKSLAYGMGVGFTLTYDYVALSDDLDEYKLYGTVYSDNKDLISDILSDKDYFELYEKISDKEFSSYKNLDDKVSVSEFGNNIKVYVNHSDVSVNSPVGNIEPYSYIVIQEG